MTWKDEKFDVNMSRKIEVRSKVPDQSQHGKTIEARTFAMVLQLKSTGQRDAMIHPQQGLMIFNTDTGRINIYQGTQWEEVTMETTTSSSSSSSSSSSTISTT